MPQPYRLLWCLALLTGLAACLHPAGGARSAPATSTSGPPAVTAAAPAAPPAPPAPAPPAVPAPPPGVPLPPAPSTSTRRLDLSGGEPTVPVRLMESVKEVRFLPRGRMRIQISGDPDKQVEAPAGTQWRVRILQGEPAEVTYFVQLAEFPQADREGLEKDRRTWEQRGVRARVYTLGSVYGIAGKVIDNRRALLLLDEPLTEETSRARAADMLRRYGARTTRFEQVRKPGTGVLELLDAAGTSVALGQNRIRARTLDDSGFDVREVEYGVGYSFHGREDRSYRGALEITVGRDGQLAVVNEVALEDLLKGLVPSEIFARAPIEALKAQAVTARGEVLAKVGTTHLADPYLLCSEQHCAVYRGRSGEAPSTSAAVDATHGEALFDDDGRLVDSVYSAVCGGHTEDNENVWGGAPNKSLRGRPDTLGGELKVSPAADLKAFLEQTQGAACLRSSFAQKGKYRWEKRFSAEEMDALTGTLGVGPVRAISVLERGVSGRARLVAIAGENGATEIRGELNIRRVFGMLNSSMFLVTAERDGQGRPLAWRFQGGGWGHGVGMCQTGAIGRAEAGQSYRTILEHYFNGARVARIY